MDIRGVLKPRQKAYGVPRVISAITRGQPVSTADTAQPIRLVAILAVAALASIALAGAWGAMLFIVAALALCAFDPLDAGRTLTRFLPLLLIPLLALASTLWSDSPQRTVRAAIQLLLTAVAAIMVARRMEERTLIAILFWGFLVICLLAVPGIPNSLATRSPLYAPFDSKNQLGFAAHMLFALGLAVICTRQARTALKLTAAVAILFSLMLALLSQSAGAQTSFALTALLFPALVVFGRIPLGWRVGALILLLALLAVSFAFMPAIEAAIADFRWNVLKKDATLTGRTYLWEVAAQISAEKPVFGHGYYAFWRHGNVEAEGLWRWAGIASRSGFNFHNAFVEMRVDLGLSGMVLLIGTCVAIGGAAVWRQLTQPTVSHAFFLALLAVFYGRSLAENGLIAPFSLPMALWMAAGVYAFSAKSADAPRRERFGKFRKPMRDVRVPRHV
jgi:exopolysaccharide production protein ExoQ